MSTRILAFHRPDQGIAVRVGPALSFALELARPGLSLRALGHTKGSYDEHPLH